MVRYTIEKFQYSVKNKLSPLLLAKNILVVFFVFQILITNSANAQNIQSSSSHNTFVSEKYGFRMTLPKSMQIQKIQRPGVAMFAKSTKRGLPTITITRHGGNYSSRSSDSHINGILDSYRRVGFNDVSYVGSSRGRFRYMPKNRNSVTVNYSSMGKKHLAEVTFISAGNQHFIITYVDQPQWFSSLSTLRKSVTESFRLNRSVLASTYNSRYKSKSQTVRARYNHSIHANKAHRNSPHDVNHRQDQYSAFNGQNSNDNEPTPVKGALMLVGSAILGAATFLRGGGKA